MIGLFFEVQTRPGHRNQYLDLAASLKPDLEAMGGCRFIDRFRSLTRENLLLSYQIWQDEGVLTAWRAHARHHDVQTIGREKGFSDYRIRVAQVIHEQRPGQPVWQPERRTPYNDPARRKPTYILASESKSATLAAETEWRRDAFASVYREEHFAHLVDLPDDRAGIEFGAHLFADPTTQALSQSSRSARLPAQSHQAPQYYPPVERNVRVGKGAQRRSFRHRASTSPKMVAASLCPPTSLRRNRLRRVHLIAQQNFWILP
jgi:heme-degrading monooxygenase HmoA